MQPVRSIFWKAIFFGTFIFGTGNFVFAQNQPASTAVEAGNTIKFTGAEGEMLVFEVELHKLPLKGSILNILDDQGNSLFEERIYAADHIRRYKIARADMRQISFKVSGKTFLFSKSFAINLL